MPERALPLRWRRAALRLEGVVASLERAEARHAVPRGDEDLLDAKSPTRSFAWGALARHNARLGAGGHIRIEEVDELFRPFLHLGIALGEQDRK